MKNLLFVSIITFTFVFSTNIVLADTSPEQSRATITRSSGHDEIERPTRVRGGSATDTSNDPEEDGGTQFDVIYTNEDGTLTITYEAGNGPGNANISVVINGEIVVSSGGQSSGGNNTSEDGEDGTDGNDGSGGTDDSSDSTEGEDSEDVDDRTSERVRDSRLVNSPEDRRPTR